MFAHISVALRKGTRMGHRRWFFLNRLLLDVLHVLPESKELRIWGHHISLERDREVLNTCILYKNDKLAPTPASHHFLLTFQKKTQLTWVEISRHLSSISLTVAAKHDKTINCPLMLAATTLEWIEVCFRGHVLKATSLTLSSSSVPPTWHTHRPLRTFAHAIPLNGRLFLQTSV